MGIPRLITWLACLVVAVHIAALWVGGGRPSGSFASNLIQLAAAVLGCFACTYAALKVRGYFSLFWACVGVSLALWALAQSGWLYYEDVLRQVVPSISPINVLFFFFLAPVAVALLWPYPRIANRERWPFILDLLQLSVVLITAYLYFFYTREFWAGREDQLNQAIRLSSESRNYILLAAILLRGLFMKGRAAARPFWQLAAACAVYAAGESFYFHLTAAARINTGHWLDLTWTIPFAMVSFFAARARQPEEVSASAGSYAFSSTIAIQLIPLSIPAIVLLMASYIVRQQLAVATISVAISFVIAAIRVLVAQAMQEKVAKDLEYTNERFRLLFAENPHPIAVMDAETRRCLEANQAAIDRYGYTREELLTVPIDIVRAEGPLPDEEFQRRRRTGGWTVEAPHRTKNGQTFIARVTGRFINFGGREAILAIVEDITQRKRAEEELRQSQQRLSLHIQQTPLAFIEWSPEGKIVDWNPAAENIFGYTREEALGKHLSFVIAEATEETSVILSPPAQAQLSVREGVKKSGKKISCDWYSTSLVDENGSILGGASLVHDVTDKRTLEDQLRQAQKMEAIGTLAGGVAHDFNNLLTVITGYSSMLQSRLKNDKQASEELQEVLDAATRAASLTNQLLTFSRKQVVKTLPVNLNDSIRNMQKLLRRLIGEDIQVQTALFGNLPQVLADPGQIEQVLMNLAVNARDAMPNGGTLRFSTTVLAQDCAGWPSSLASEQCVVLSVADSGCGMDANTKAHIFEPFFTTKVGTGTGLGLSTVFGIVRSVGGVVEVDSGIGVGTTFRIYFPAVSAPESEPSPYDEVIADRPLATETIMLVEDDQRLRQLTSHILRELGYEVIAAADGTSAAEISMQFGKKIDLVLTDVVLPNQSGPEVAATLRKHRPEIKVLYTSGYTDNPTLRSALGSGNSNFIQKPFTPEALAQKVRSVLDVI